MWAVGCVLYELLTLRRAFDASNPLRLVHLVVNENPDLDIALYSQPLISVLESLLKKDSSQRPSANDLLQHELFAPHRDSFDARIAEIFEIQSAKRQSPPNAVSIVEGDLPSESQRLMSKLLSKQVSSGGDSNSAFSASSVAAVSCRLAVVTAKSTELFSWGGGRYVPQKLEFFGGESDSTAAAKDRAPTMVSVGRAHFAVVSVLKELYTWAIQSGGSPPTRGQLGHGTGAITRVPKKVSSRRRSAFGMWRAALSSLSASQTTGASSRSDATRVERSASETSNSSTATRRSKWSSSGTLNAPAFRLAHNTRSQSLAPASSTRGVVAS